MKHACNIDCVVVDQWKILQTRAIIFLLCTIKAVTGRLHNLHKMIMAELLHTSVLSDVAFKHCKGYFFTLRPLHLRCIQGLIEFVYICSYLSKIWLCQNNRIILLLGTIFCLIIKPSFCRIEVFIKCELCKVLNRCNFYAVFLNVMIELMDANFFLVHKIIWFWYFKI